MCKIYARYWSAAQTWTSVLDQHLSVTHPCSAPTLRAASGASPSGGRTGKYLTPTPTQTSLPYCPPNPPPRLPPLPRLLRLLHITPWRSTVGLGSPSAVTLANARVGSVKQISLLYSFESYRSWNIQSGQKEAGILKIKFMYLLRFFIFYVN